VLPLTRWCINTAAAAAVLIVYSTCYTPQNGFRKKKKKNSFKISIENAFLKNILILEERGNVQLFHTFTVPSVIQWRMNRAITAFNTISGGGGTWYT